MYTTLSLPQVRFLRLKDNMLLADDTSLKRLQIFCIDKANIPLSTFSAIYSKVGSIMKGGEKNMLSKKILVPVFAIVIAGSTLVGVSAIAHAQTGTTPFAGLAQAIASKFNLNQSDVQSAITSYMQQNMQNRQKNRLDKLVSAGKITSAQETAILAELATLQSQYSPSSFQGMTQAQRQQAMQDRKNALTTWANAQGINPAYVMPFGMGHRGRWHKPTGTPTPTP